MSGEACPTCNGKGRIACPGPWAKTNAERQAAGRMIVDWCYGMHMGHTCPDCTDEQKGCPPHDFDLLRQCRRCGLGSVRRAESVVWVVVVDWGTMDGYPSRIVIDSVWANEADAERRVDECKERSPFPALYAKAEQFTVGPVVPEKES